MTIAWAILAFIAGIVLGVLASPRGGVTFGRRAFGPHEAAIRKALVAVASGDAAAATAALRRAVQLDSSNDALYLLMGNELSETGDFSRAERVADVLLSRRDLPKAVVSGAWRLKGRAAEAAGRRDEALAAYRAATDAAPASPPAWIDLGRLLALERRWKEAVEAAASLTGVAEESGRRLAARRLTLLARELLADGKAAEAAQAAERALRDGDLGAAHLVLGDAKFQLGHISDAIGSWSAAAAAAFATAPLVVLRLEQIAERGGDAERPRTFALDALARTHGADPTDWRLHAWLADDALRAGRVAEARDWCREVEKSERAPASATRLRVRCDLADASAEGLRKTAARWAEEPVWVDPWRCRVCGSAAEELEWRCPSCHAWAKME